MTLSQQRDKALCEAGTATVRYLNAIIDAGQGEHPLERMARDDFRAMAKFSHAETADKLKALLEQSE